MNPLLRKAISAVSAATAAAVLATPVFAAETTVTFLAVQPPVVFEPLIEAFEKANPDIKIDYQRVPFVDLNAAIESRIGQGDKSIDVFAADTPRVPYMANRGFLSEIDDRRADIEAAVPSKTEIESVSFDGKIYSYPLWGSTNMMFYNRDVLKKAGIAEPGSAQGDRLTWQALQKLAAKAQAEGGAEWGIMFQQVDRYYQLQPLFESSGAGSGLKGPGLLEPNINTEKWVETAQWYADLFEKKLAPRGVTPQQTDEMFGNGKIAFYIGGSWAMPRFAKGGLTNYGVAPMPYFEGGKPVTNTGAWSLAINPHSEKKEAARKFVEFTTLTGEGSHLSVKNFPLPPVHKDGFELFTKDFQVKFPEHGAVMDITAYELESTAVVRPRTIGFVAFETVMNKAFSDVRNGSDVKQTLDDGQAQLSSAFRRLK